jgi:hypothetical protein
MENAEQDALINATTALNNAPLPALMAQYAEIFGKKTDATSDVYLRRKIAYRLQEDALGGLSRKAKAKIAELIEKCDPINNKVLRPTVVSGGKEVNRLGSMRDKRLPIPGTILRKRYKGQDIEVRVLEKGFEYNGKRYRTLTAVAVEVTGVHWSGYTFFNV